jgi:hypothetical protein
MRPLPALGLLVDVGGTVPYGPHQRRGLACVEAAGALDSLAQRHSRESEYSRVHIYRIYRLFEDDGKSDNKEKRLA